MGGLFSSLNSSVEALRAIESALAVSQNNVSNANTPGYARQIAQFNSQAFNLSAGLAGGVQFGGTQSTQNEYAQPGGADAALGARVLQRENRTRWRRSNPCLTSRARRA